MDFFIAILDKIVSRNCILSINSLSLRVKLTNMKPLLPALVALFLALGAHASSRTEVFSPDGRISVTIQDGTYYLTVDGRTAMSSSIAELKLSDGRTFGTSAKARKIRISKSPEKIFISSPFYRQESLFLEYNSLTMDFGKGWGMEWIVSDQGAAYRFFGGESGVTTTVIDETASFVFNDDYELTMAYSTNKKKPYAMAFQNTYRTESLSKADAGIPAFLPASINTGEARVTILESDIQSYPVMFVRPEKGCTALVGEFPSYPSAYGIYPGRQQQYVKETGNYISKFEGVRTFPWRILAVSRKDTEMPVNDLVYALAEPSRIDDTSWIKPGFSAWEWWNDWGLTGVDFKAGINMPTYRKYIDFASENGLEYLILDEGWYVPSSGDMLTPIPELDLPALVKYAAEKNVKLILWTVFNVLDDKLEETCKHYADMGIAGFKVDFLDRGDQTAVEMAWRIAEAAARHHLVLDYHGIYPPAGMNRTYPNVLNFESVFGMEEVKWGEIDINMPSYLVTFPFIRQMCGYTDFTQGAMLNATKEDFHPVYSNPYSMGTRAQQVALYVVVDSPLTMLCDTPSRYEKEKDVTNFISTLPRIYDETRCIDGKIGEYVVMARRSGENWYVGGLTDWTGREMDIKFDFLPEGEYFIKVLKDGENAGKNASDYTMEPATANLGDGFPGFGRQVRTVTNDDSIHIAMAPGGGFVIKLIKKTVLPEGKKIHIPEEWGGQDPYDPESQWSYSRMFCTENTAIFWQKGFGADPSEAPDLCGHPMRWDINNLAENIERFYKCYRDEMKFILPGSLADEYRMVVHVRYDLEGTAYGGDVDGTIGALWVTPGRIQDERLNCIAHELGHSFQSQISCDDMGQAWGGSPFFEMTSQWMLWYVNPEWQTSEKYHWDAWNTLTHKSFLSFENMYHSPYVLEDWATRHGVQVIADLYREGKRGEDPVITYKRHFGLSQEQFNDEMWNTVCHFVNWDYERVWEESRPYANRNVTKLEPSCDGWQRISKENCPEDYGFNAIPVEVPHRGQTVSIDFKGEAGLDGFNGENKELAGWRYGFMAVGADGHSIYYPVHRSAAETVSYTAPYDQDLEHLWFVVMGAPKEHIINSPAQWPYSIKINK